MRARVVQIGVVAAALLSLAACTDEKRDLIAPRPPNTILLTPIGTPIKIERPRLPSPEDFLDITAGSYHTCARKFNGNVYCWGMDGGGQVFQVPALAWTGAAQIDAGGGHTCGLNSSGAAYCWGGGNQGQLGLGTFTTSNGAWPVSGPGYGQPALTFSSISGGGTSTCGTTPAGVYCWGALGNPATPGSPTPYPTLITNWRGDSYNGFAHVSAGNLHACGLNAGTHEVWCWAANGSGQVGIDPAALPWAPFAVNTGLGTSVSRVSTQHDFTCADLQNGTVQCFGSNEYGQLGNGRSGYGTDTYMPQTVGSGQLRGVSTGWKHACALDPNGAAWCWGYGLYGQIGNNAWANTFSTPQRVTGGHSFRAIAAGALHTCAIGTDNHIYCWGQNVHRQLGTDIWVLDANGFPVAGPDGRAVKADISPNPVQTNDPR